MNTTSRQVRFAAAFASVAITYSLVASIAGMAKPHAASGMQMAQAAAATIVR